MTVREVGQDEKKLLHEIVAIHLDSFTGFFLSFMGRGFLYHMYQSYCRHDPSHLLVAEEEGQPVGFLAYSSDFSGLYKYMIKTKLVPFAWYSLGAFIRRPAAFFHIIKAFLKPGEAKRPEAYVELSSIGVKKNMQNKGAGSALILELKNRFDFTKYAYITLETDADNNEGANAFYVRNGFALTRTYATDEGRKMNEYRYSKNDPVS